MSQIAMVDLDSFLPSTHPYRRFRAYLPEPRKARAEVSQVKGADGYGIKRLFRCLLLQFMEDHSNRELERYQEENLAANGFVFILCLSLLPTISLFTRVRIRIGPTRRPLPWLRRGVTK